MLHSHAWAYGGQIGQHDFVCDEVHEYEKSEFVGSTCGEEGADFV